MNRKNLEDLLTSSGFILWEDEPWKPHSDALVDWSSDYDEDIQVLIKQVAQICYDLCDNAQSQLAIKKYFKL